MYQVISLVDGTEHTLMDTRDEKYVLGTPKLTLQINNAGLFTFSIHPTHPEIGSIIPLVSIIKVYKTDRSNTYRKWLFTGRVVSSENDIYNTGKVKCEGILAYLLDSIVYPYEYQGTPADYVRQLIESHNSQMNDTKRFILRTLDLSDVDSNNNIVRANRNYPATLDEIKNKVVKLLNAYISVEDVEGKLYIDCNQSILHYNEQVIRMGENIIDLKQTKSAGEIRTVMIGIGAENDDGNKPTVTVENNEAVKKYGRIVGTVKFENVTTIAQLTKKTQAYLDEIVNETNAVEIKAVDLNMTDQEIESIGLGYCYVESDYNNLNHTRMLVSKMEIYLTQPEKNTFSLGAALRSMTTRMSHANADIESRINRVANSISPKIQNAVENATQMITGAKGGYVILDCGENADGHPERILIMDSPDKTLANHVIQINKNGIGFSTTGIGGPYANAWTIDGNLVADFITAGTMFADRIRGGTLEIGGEKDGVITVLDGSGNTVATIDREGVNVLKGKIRGATVTVGGTCNADGVITVLDGRGNTVATIDKEGVNVLKGNIRGATVTVGGTGNADGVITVLDGRGNTKITIDADGINVNDKFSVDMEGKMTAIEIDGAAVEQISDIIDNSDAMKKAKQAIKTAQDAADKANSAAGTAQSAAETAQGAAEKAQKAADAANKAIKETDRVVDNLNDVIIPKINGWINQISAQLKNLGQAGIS